MARAGSLMERPREAWLDAHQEGGRRSGGTCGRERRPTVAGELVVQGGKRMVRIGSSTEGRKPLNDVLWSEVLKGVDVEECEEEGEEEFDSDVRDFKAPPVKDTYSVSSEE